MKLLQNLFFYNDFFILDPTCKDIKSTDFLVIQQDGELLEHRKN